MTLRPVKMTSSVVAALVVLVVAGSGRADAFLDGLESLKEFLDGLTPHLKKGLEAVKQVEEFVSSTIDEECLYECPDNRALPAPRPGHVPSSNGCGSFDFLFDDSPESPIHVEKAFTDCCDVHDLCYDTCNEDKERCDLAFKKCLYSECRRLGPRPGFLDLAKCKAKAKLLYLTVVGVGCQSFREAQKLACRCVVGDPGVGRDEL